MTQFIKEKIETDFKRFFNNVGKRKDYIGDIVIIKVRKLKGCSMDINGPIVKFNMTKDPEYGIIKTRFKVFYDNEYKVSIGTARGFDTLFIVTLNKGKGTVEKVYAIPEKALDGKRMVKIPDTGNEYQKFQINEKPYNDMFCSMKTGKYSIFEDEDITINHIDK